MIHGAQVFTAKRLTLAMVLLLAVGSMPESATAQGNFYDGQTIRIIQGRRPGGTGDMRTRAVVELLSKYIPGNPSVLFEYMPGGGGRKAANYIYNASRPDGLTLANIGAGFLTNAVLGASGVKYDFNQMIFLGSGNSKASYVFTTRKQAGYVNVKQLLQGKGLRIGTLSVGHDIYTNARMFAWLLRLKEPKFIPGYSGPELDQAVIAGEVDARVNITDTVLQRNRDWIEDKLADFHSVFEIPQGYRAEHPVFNDLPSLESFTQTEKDRAVLAMSRTFRLVGSPYLVGPGVPQDRVDILRNAFNKVFTDPKLPAIWEKLTGEPPSALLPDEQTEAVRNLPRDREIIETFKKLAGPGALPGH